MGSKTKKNRIVHKNKATAAISNLIIEANYVEIYGSQQRPDTGRRLFVALAERRNQSKFVLFRSYSVKSTNDAFEMWKIKVW